MIQRLVIFFLLIHLSFSNGYSQVDLNNGPKIETDSTKQEYKKRGLMELFEGKPGKAAMYALLVPGGGQIYNRRWWKVPIALTAEGLFITNIVRKRRIFRNFDQKWRAALDGGIPLAGCEEYTTANQIKEERDDARQEMEYSWVYWGLTHIVVTFEAYVDRHLMEFDVSEDLSIRLKPIDFVNPELGEISSIGLTYRIN